MDIQRQHALFACRHITDDLRRDGFVSLPGITVPWHQRLNPARNELAWMELRQERVQAHLHGNILQRDHFVLTDEGFIDAAAQQSVSFFEKERKAHLTVREAAVSWLRGGAVFLPTALAGYMSACCDFIEAMRAYLYAVLPPPPFPVTLTLRIFQYAEAVGGMKSHIDGSVLTLIVAASDGRLEVQKGDEWIPARTENDAPFAIVIPGMAAKYLEVSPLPHRVLTGAAQRSSITVFVTPDLGRSKGEAERRLAAWSLNLPEATRA